MLLYGGRIWGQCMGKKARKFGLKKKLQGNFKNEKLVKFWYDIWVKQEQCLLCVDFNKKKN